MRGMPSPDEIHMFIPGFFFSVKTPSFELPPVDFALFDL
jgi:hypothetical protein